MSLRKLSTEPSQALLGLVIARGGGLAVPERRPRRIPAETAHAGLGEENGIPGLGNPRRRCSVAAGGGALIGEAGSRNVTGAQQLVAAFDEGILRLGRKRQRCGLHGRGGRRSCLEWLLGH